MLVCKAVPYHTGHDIPVQSFPMTRIFSSHDIKDIVDDVFPDTPQRGHLTSWHVKKQARRKVEFQPKMRKKNWSI